MKDAWNCEAAGQLMAPLGFAPIPGVELWTQLARDTKDAIESNDSVLVHRNGYIIYGLIRLSRREIDSQFGRDFWQRAQAEIDHEPKARSCLHVLRAVGSMNRRDAVVTLLDLGQRGIVYLLPGGRKKGWWGQGDCGLADFVDLTRVLSQLLPHPNATGPSVQPTGSVSNAPGPSVQQTGSASNVAPVMRVRLDGTCLHLALSIGGKPVRRTSVTGQTASLLQVLSSADYRRMVQQGYGKIDEFLHDHVWPKNNYVRPREGGTPPKLRTAVKVARALIHDVFGELKSGDPWVVRLKNPSAYALTPQVKWKVNDGEIASRTPTFDPQELDQQRWVTANHVRITKESHDQDCERRLINRPKLEASLEYCGPHAE